MAAHMTLRAAIAASFALLAAAAVTPASAGSLSVGKWTTEESCQFYVTEWEREIAVSSNSSQSAGAAVITPYGAAAARRSSSQSSASRRIKNFPRANPRIWLATFCSPCGCSFCTNLIRLGSSCR